MPIIFESEQLEQLTDILVPAEIRQAPATMDRVVLRLAHADPADGRVVHLELYSEPAAPHAGIASTDNRIHMLNIVVEGTESTPGPTRIFGNQMSIAQMHAETSFHEVLASTQFRYPNEVAWGDQALRAL